MRNVILFAATAAFFAFSSNAQAAAYYCPAAKDLWIHNFSADGRQYFISSKKYNGAITPDTATVTISGSGGYTYSPLELTMLNPKKDGTNKIIIDYYPRYKSADGTLMSQKAGPYLPCLKYIK